MRFMGVREAQQHLSEAIDESQGKRVVLTRHGRPAAVLRGVEGLDAAEVVMQNDPAFWKLIEARRAERGKGRSQEDVERMFGVGKHGRRYKVKVK